MLVDKSVIDTDYSPLKTSDSIESARLQMERQKAEKLPVVNHEMKLSGQISLNQLQQAKDDVLLGDLEPDETIKIYQGQHFFEAARLIQQYELAVLPVIDAEWTFLGGIDKQKVLQTLTKMLNLTEFGSVITVELSQMDFTISEIVQIIEVEDAKILGLTVETPDEENQSFLISFKLNLQDLSRVTAALQRYGYYVFSETEAESESFSKDLETRADELIKFIDM